MLAAKSAYSRYSTLSSSVGCKRATPARVYAITMDKKPPHDESKNRFAEVIRQSQERRAELNNKARKKQIDDIELPPRDEEIADAKEEDEPEV
jgi:hypothetical protein